MNIVEAWWSRGLCATLDSGLSPTCSYWSHVLSFSKIWLHFFSPTLWTESVILNRSAMFLERNKMHLSSNETRLDPCKTEGGTLLWAVIEPVNCWDILSAVLWCNLDHRYSTHFASTSTDMYINTMVGRGTVKGVSCPIIQHSGPCKEPLKPRPFDLEFHAIRNIRLSHTLYIVLNFHQTLTFSWSQQVLAIQFEFES